MECAHDLRRAPSLVNAEVGYDIRGYDVELSSSRQSTHGIARAPQTDALAMT